MVKQKIFLSLISCICMVLGLFYTLPSYAELIQGDGEASETADLLTDEKDDTAEDAVATITAEGDFLLPTYLLPVEGEVASKDMIEVKETKTTTTTIQELPIVLTSETAGIRPVPVNDDINIDIDVANLSNVAGSTTPREARQLGTGHKSSTTTTTTARTTPILIPLAVMPTAPEVETSPDKYVRHVVPSEYADQFLNASEQGGKPSFIMPQEIKVSFYKNATEFSGQTLKWIKAFTKNALSDPRLIVEIRASAQDPEIQYKRLTLIRNTLMSYGLSSHQIRMVQTNRSPDSVVLRAIPKTDATEVVVTKSTTGKKIKKQTITW